MSGFQSILPGWRRRGPSLLAAAIALTFAGCSSLVGPGPGHLPTIGRLDTFAGADSILVVWDTGNYPPFDLDGRPAAPTVTTVGLLLSTTGPGSGFSRISDRARVGADSMYVTGLQSGKSYFFRLETYDRRGALIDRSRPLETQLGPPAQEVASFGTVSGDGGLYYPPMAWTRDGQGVIFIAGEREAGPNLVVHDLATGNEHALTAFPAGPARLLGVAVAPDSDQVAFSYSVGEQGGPYSIRVLDLASGVVRAITDGPVDADPAWARGGRIYFTRGTMGPPNIPQVYSTSADGLETVVAVLRNDQYKYGLNVDPTAGRIAFSAYTTGAGDIENQSLYAVTLATGHVDRLLAASPSDNQAPAWSASGAEVFFVSNRSGHYEAWSLNVADGRLTQRTRAQARGAECRAARPSPDGTRLALYQTQLGLLDGSVRVIRLQ